MEKIQIYVDKLSSSEIEDIPSVMELIDEDDSISDVNKEGLRALGYYLMDKFEDAYIYLNTYAYKLNASIDNKLDSIIEKMSWDDFFEGYMFSELTRPDSSESGGGDCCSWCCTIFCALTCCNALSTACPGDDDCFTSMSKESDCCLVTSCLPLFGKVSTVLWNCCCGCMMAPLECCC